MKQVDKTPALAPTTEEIAQRAYEIFRALRAMIVWNEIPPRVVEWVER